MPLRFSVLTLGCRVNQADSFECERDLLARGCVRGTVEAADLVVVNTCSVTVAADQAARQAIRRVARKNPGARIVVTGCYATRRPCDLGGLPGVARLVPNGLKCELADLALRAADPAVPAPPALVPAPRLHPGDRGRTAFPLRVQSGCDERCTYCTIPQTRGPSRSRPLDEIVREAESLAAADYKEVILTGVHLGAWGRDLAPALSLADLLGALDAVAGDLSFRISSLEPMDCTPAVIDLVAQSARFAPHFHLPLQHASDRLLGAMQRPYALADYARLVASIRAALPHAAIGCDVIVGFPGETEADHELAASWLAASPVTHLHVFPYSERPGTGAAAMRPKVPASVARRRAGELRQVSLLLSRAFAAWQEGRVRPGLTIGDGSRVLTDNHLEVRIPPGRSRNQRVMVRLTDAASMEGVVEG